jgi:thiol-disulfide isomerase/thioredoxin
MQKTHFIILLLIIYSNTTFGQTYYEQHKICSEVLKDAPIGDSLFWEKLKVRDNCLIGLEVPSFEVTTLKDEKFETDSLRGKVIVLNFWFTKCAPCIAEMPFLNKVVSEYKNEKILFLSIANEDSATLEKFLKTKKFDFEVVPNGSSILTQTLKLFSAWPTTIIVDTKGKIRFIKMGGFEDEDGDFIKVLNETLK